MSDDRWRTWFQRGFAALAAAGIAFTTIELALLRHWSTPAQVIPWFVLAGLGLALAAVITRPSAVVVRVVRVVAAIAATAAAYGVYAHVRANYDAGPLDFRYAVKWAAMSPLSRWWAALTESVGPSPVLAPAVLAQTAACLLLTTFGRARRDAGAATA